jgi:GH24 family phage-related lysozyme (muramidase)
MYNKYLSYAGVDLEKARASENGDVPGAKAGFKMEDAEMHAEKDTDTVSDAGGDTVTTPDDVSNSKAEGGPQKSNTPKQAETKNDGESRDEKKDKQSFDRFKPVEMSSSEDVKERLKQREVYSKMPYDDDGAKNCTIGYGHLLHRGACTEENYARHEDGWSKEKAQEVFEKDVSTHEEIIKKYVEVDLSQGEFDALAHVVFNVGEPGFKTSTLLKKLNSGDYKGVPDEIRRWDKGTVNEEKIVIDGLKNRREDEIEIYNKK